MVLIKTIQRIPSGQEDFGRDNNSAFTGLQTGSDEHLVWLCSDVSQWSVFVQWRSETVIDSSSSLLKENPSVIRNLNMGAHYFLTFY